ncbi:MAG: Bax inhibitor-1 family protein, partial [Planctomycetota bacterium]
MSQGEFQAANPYASFGSSIADAPASERADFIRKTYSHLTMAVFACAALVWAFFQTGLLDQFAPILLQNRMYMLVVFGGFMLVSWIADNWARSTTSVEKQYAGLVLYVAAEAVFLAPMLWAANQYSLEFSNGETVSILPAASLITLVMFGGLSAIAWFSGADFSFL